MWGKLTEWFEKSGYEKIFSNIGIYHSSISDVLALNESIKSGYRVVTLVSAGMLAGYQGDTLSKNHWIVWTEQLSDEYGIPISNSTLDGDKVTLSLFSWGKVGGQLKSNINLDVFLKHVFGGLVFKPIK